MIPSKWRLGLSQATGNSRLQQVSNDDSQINRNAVNSPQNSKRPKTKLAVIACAAWILATCFEVEFASAIQQTDENPPKAGENQTEPLEEKAVDDRLYFSFAGSKWSDVIDWLADTGGLALHVDELPKGTFTYQDADGFTLQESIDRINLFLLPEGFTLVRSGKLLSVINLSDPKSAKQLDTLARLVKAEDLDKLEDHDMVKCLFSLGELKSEEAVEELAALNLLKAPDIFSRTNQLLITDTAGKLKLAKNILAAFEPDALANGTVVKSFRLNHVAAEDVLTVARPHLGLATGEMIGIDVSISADLLGKNIFVTGVEDKVKLIEGLIREIDVEEKKKSGTELDILQSHRVAGGNVQMVYNVLQTLLSGEEIRLSMDQTSQSIIAFAPEEIQQEISKTVEQLQGAEDEFAVIPLKHADPYFVITLLEQMLDIEDDTFDTEFNNGRESDPRRGSGNWRGWNGGMFGNPNDGSGSPPKIDADPAGKKLFVLGSKYQIEQIRQIVVELDVPKGSIVGSDNNLRIFPLRGAKAVNAIETAARFWQGKNSIIFYPSAKPARKKVTERVIADEPNPSETKNQESESKQELGSGRILSKKLNTDDPPIQIQLNEQGILLQCEDIEALDKFEEILRTVVGPVDSISSAPIIYYLKYAKPDEAIRMLAELLDGGDSAEEAESSTLVNGLVLGSSDFFFGSLVSSREGTLTLTYGSTTVVADTRLNRLIAQGTVNELERVEAYLKIIDKDQSITSIEVYGTSHVIELKNLEASDVAETLRQAFYGRVAGATTNNQKQAQQQGQKSKNQPQPNRQPSGNQNNQPRDGRDRNQNREPNRQQPAKPPAQNRAPSSNEPKMTIAVHEASNSLIVTAPEPLFKEVEKLAKLLDSKSVQKIEVLKISRPLSSDLQQILMGNQPLPTPSVPRNVNPFPSNGGNSRDRSRRRDSSRSR